MAASLLDVVQQVQEKLSKCRSECFGFEAIPVIYDQLPPDFQAGFPPHSQKVIEATGGFLDTLRLCAERYGGLSKAKDDYRISAKRTWGGNRKSQKSLVRVGDLHAFFLGIMVANWSEQFSI